MQFKETTKSKNYLYKGKILNLRKDDVELPNCKEAIREIVEHSGGSTIYCENNGKVLFVKQYRYAYGEEILELPAGKLNVGENPETTALRELEEECGVKAKKIEKLFEVYPTPGYSNEIIRIYRAWDLQESKVNLDEDEFLDSLWIEKGEALKMIKDGEIKDAKTLIALLYMLKNEKLEG